MYRIITLLTIILLPFLLQAQKAPAIVKGVVFDTASKRGLAYATISVVNAKDSTLVTFTRADSTGKFKLSSLEKGKYLLSSSYVGFIPVWRSVEINKDGEEIDLGKLNMTDVLNSGNVTVIARRPPVTINNDTVEFNTENFKTQPNAVVEDMLKKLPGVTVDNDGTVRVNGQKVNRVLVNGKEFFTGDPKMATKNLDADAVDKVQVFDKKSDRAEFTGVDDGQSEKTINLKLKKDRNNAVFGKVSAAAGTNKRYDGQTNINKFNGDQQMSFIGMGNNTNKQGFSISDILNFSGDMSRSMRSGGGGITINMSGGGDNNGLPVTGAGQNAQGVATTFAGGINYNDTWNNRKTDFNMSGMGSNIDLRTDRVTNQHYIIPGNEYNYVSNSNTARTSKQQRVNMMIDSRIDSFNSFKFTPSFTTQQTDSRSTSSYSSTRIDGTKINDGSTDNSNHSDAFNFGGNALFRKRFQKKGRTISSNLSLAYNDSKQDGSLYTRLTSYTAGIPKDSLTNQKNRREAVTRSFGANVVYTEPIGKRSLVELSAYYNANIGDSKRITYDYAAASGKYDKMNTTQSNDFKSEYTFTGGSLSFRSNLKKMSLTVGSSLQEAKLYSTNNTLGNVIKQSFTDALPNANIQYRLTSSRTLTVNYSTSTTQPTTTQLQPVVDVSNPLNTYKGNPDLKRSYAQSVSLNYFSSNMYTQRNFFAFISATKTDNAIITSENYNTVNTTRESTPINANGNYMLFGSINAGFPLKKIKSRIDLGLGTNILHNISFLNGARNEIDNFSVSPNLQYGFSLENKIDINATGRLNISKAKYSLQPMLSSNYLQQVYSLDMTNYLPWGLVINNNFNYTINSGRADGFNTTVGYWNASVAKSFLKNKRAEIKLSAFDLLNQNQGISRNANQNYLEDSRYNVLQQYFTLGFTFSLNKAGNAGTGPRIVTRMIGG
ncbi:MAG: outer membrane beta-barrel protein [Bacteroidota bacterium]